MSGRLSAQRGRVRPSARRSRSSLPQGSGRTSGHAARATLYFTLRYPKLGKYSDEALTHLLEWHERDEVGQYERHRNAAIFEGQGNRNPLIDHPEWASGIDFTGAL